ncbi:pseudouridine synthase [uncultured Tenacibaculum sp.]|uniref:pseudouridine synthase n=1 Tax=uncultured Tenacibaculum sp. TaxID=174713 RepID=UPI0026356984|nr:pseudouridine synthase [uncultured Tenacibaculum sp.]
MKLEVIYQDEYIVCVTKPNNVVVHHAHHSRNVSDEKSLLQLLDEQIKGKYYPIHRLDRKTSGIILLAKETKFVSKFQNLFTENLIQKTYYGIVRGHSPQSTIIDSPVKGRDSNVYKEAETKLETIKQKILEIPVKPYDTSRYSLVKLTPKTGRLHQLRIHTNKISHPLIGDPKYGDKNHNMMFIENFDCDNLFLHAYSLEFIHPFLNKKFKLTSNFTENWKVIFDKFNWEI